MMTDARRILKVNDSLLLGGGSNFADFQYLQGVVEDTSRNYGLPMDALSLQTFLRKGLYNRFIKEKALRIDLLLAGMHNDLPYLCRMDHRGYTIQERVAATGLVANMVLPFLKNELAKTNILDEKMARELLRRSMEILYKRHTLAHPKYYVGVVDECGVKLGKDSLLLNV
ncbi:hypothetical protein WDU94_011952 [Cyamophila willieti]